MRSKELFRVFVRAIGLWVIASYIPSLLWSISAEVNAVAFAATDAFYFKDWLWTFASNQIPTLVAIGVGVYLLLGGESVVKLAYGGARCETCGRRRKAEDAAGCPECGSA